MVVKRSVLLFLSVLLFPDCSTDAIKEKINKAGDVAGQTAGEFMEGASKGIRKAFDIKVELPEDLKEKGLAFGKTTITSDAAGTDNVLVLYVIFNKDFDGKLTAKVYDDANQEMGRAAMPVKGKKDEAMFIEFHFDKHTNVDSKNRVTVN